MKSKRVLTILLSLAIMMTFMPTLAFAGDAVPRDAEGHGWVKDSSEVAATCTTGGVDVMKCIGEDITGGHLDCGATKKVFTEPLDHCDADGNSATENKQFTVEEFYDKLAADGYITQEQADVAKLTVGPEACYLFTHVCKQCGKIAAYKDSDGDIYFEEIEFENHKAPKDTPACAASFTCAICGKDNCVIDGKYDQDTADAKHATYVGNADKEDTYVAAKRFCVRELGNTDYGIASVTKHVCKDCGKEFKTDVVYGSGPVGGELTGPNPNKFAQHSFGKGIASVPAGESANQYYYNEYEQLYYAPNFVVTPATCIRTGISQVKCTECGEVRATIITPRIDHNYVEVSVPATHYEPAYTAKVCTVCGKKVDKTYSGNALGHSYKVTKVADATCYSPALMVIECTTPGCKKYPRQFSSAADYEEAINEGIISAKENNEYFFCGFDKELKKTATSDTRISLGNWEQLTHDFGKYEDIAEPTCEAKGIQAKKCANCGLYYVHTKLSDAKIVEVGSALGHQYEKTTQEPTCGAKGFEYEQCGVCGKINYKTAKAFGKPVVKYGAKCTFDKWVVESPATPFKEGTKKLVCSVCGDDGHLVLEEVAGEFSVKEMGVTRASIAKTKIAAPKVKAGKKKAVVTVKAVEGAVKYQIKVNGKVKKTVKKAGKVTIKKLKGGKKAKFQIVAFNDEGVKAASKVKTVKIKK